VYKKILVALDGSLWSNLALETVQKLGEKIPQCEVLGCHVYTAKLHRERFEQMENGLPDRYQEEQKLGQLRSTHENLITDGMQLISDAYLAPLFQSAKKSGFICKGVTLEGPNYLKLLNLIADYKPDLIVMGAWGHGRVAESQLGGLTERILLHAGNSDLMIIRQPWVLKEHPVVVGVDGSQDSFAAVHTAIHLAKLDGGKLHGIAVYDPYFHLGVFKTISESLPEKDKQSFDFTAQEKLHDEIIDQGLEKIYESGVNQAALFARSLGVNMQTKVLAGKVYPQIHHYASLTNASFVVVGRWGLHRQEGSLIGSNSHNLARLINCNLIITRTNDHPIILPEEIQPSNGQDIPWTAEAEERLKRIPPFARRMAQKVISERAREQGIAEITADFVQQMARNMGRG
jgi:nucleotide-binding universal stress UspA family protein